jgi:hypothetical protein
MSRRNRAWRYALQSDPDRNPQFRRDWSSAVPVRRRQEGAVKNVPEKPRQAKKS